MKNVFVYGSLMYEEVWNRLIKNRYLKQEATLSGYRRMAVKGELYPALIQTNKHQVDGIVYRQIKNNDLLLLDRFEGKYYRRVSVLVSLNRIGEINADVYILKRKYRNLLANSEWDPEKFRTKTIRKFLTMYAGF